MLKLITSIDSTTKKYTDVTKKYHANPKKINHTNLITVLHNRSQKRTLRKNFTLTDEGYWDLASPEDTMPRYFSYSVFNVPNLAAFAQLFEDLEKDPNACIVYGLPHPSWKPGSTARRQKKTLLSRKTSWLILDIDKLKIPNFDERTKPKNCVNRILKRLSIIPGIPDNAASVWHVSSSWGKPESKYPKIHLVLRLTAPIKVSRIRALQKHINKKYKKKKVHIDPAITTPNQILYTSKPRFIGLDPAEVERLNNLDRVFYQKGKMVDSTQLLMDVPEVEQKISKPVQAGDAEEFDYVLQKIQEQGLLKSNEPNSHGKWNIVCPYEAQHSVSNESSTTIAEPNDDHGPQFWCMHENTHEEHKLSWHWYLKELAKEEIIDPDEIRNIRQGAARLEFKPPEDNNNSDWYADQIQDNYVFVETEDSFFNKITRVKLSAATFNRIHNTVWLSDQHKETEEKPLSGSRAFFRKDFSLNGGQSVAREVWNPATDELIVKDDCHLGLNSWYGFPLDPEPGNCDIFYEHIALLLPDEKEQQIMLDYLAHVFQYPHERPTWAIVHVFPKQGLGRGRLHTLICNILGNLARTVKLKNLLDSPYNPYLYKSLWVGTEETQQSKNNSENDMDDLNDMITAETANINLKYGAYYEGVPIYSRHFFMTNHLNALPLDPTDRRFWICGPDSLDYKVQNESYYTRLQNAVSDIKFQQAVMFDLIARDLSNFNPGKVPPKSELAIKMQEASAPIVDEAFDYIRADKKLPDVAPVKKIKQWIQEYAKENSHGDSAVTGAELSSKIASLPWYCTEKDKEAGRNATLVSTTAGRLRFKILRNEDVIKDKQPELIKRHYNRHINSEFK